jgi:nitroreductase
MTITSFEQISAVIRNRHTTKAVAMNGREVPDEQIEKLIALADWAPTHGHTEPWRFFIFGGDALKDFGREHADLYWSHTDEAKRNQAKCDKLVQSARNASHLIITVMKRSVNTKIPAIEEMFAVAAALQNMLLGATALGISSFWSTGGMTHHQALKTYLKLGDDDKVIGLLYLGYTDEPERKRRRNIPLAEKIVWM